MARDRGVFCVCCGDWRDRQSERRCRACRMVPPDFVRAVSWSGYTTRLRSAVHHFKYQGMRELDRPFGQMLAQAMLELAGETPKGMLLIPIPLHWRRERHRGFNQSRLLANAAMQSLRKSNPVWPLELAPKALLRQRATTSQTGLDPRMRRQNVSGAFEVLDKSAVAGRAILLVDDIMTTGATAREAATVLMRSGAESVRVATLARARGAEKKEASTGMDPVRTQPAGVGTSVGISM